jgi:hypothetical protein
VVEVEVSGCSDSAKPILRLPERNEEDTAWTRADGTRCEWQGQSEGRRHGKSKPTERLAIQRGDPNGTGLPSGPIAARPRQAYGMGQDSSSLPSVRQVFAPAQVDTDDRGYKITDSHPVPTVRHYVEVESRQGGLIPPDLLESAENASNTVGVLCPLRLHASVRRHQFV